MPKGATLRGSSDLSAEDVLALRSESGEMEYRLRVMELLHVNAIPGLGDPPPAGPQRRRVEGFVRLPHLGVDRSELVGLVMFAVGGSGAGALSDIRSKNANISAKSLLKEHPEASFIIVVVTRDPLQKVCDLADSCGSFVLGDGSQRPVIWVVTVADVVWMADRFRALQRNYGSRSWLRKFPLPWPSALPPAPVHPLVAAA